MVLSLALQTKVSVCNARTRLNGGIRATYAVLFLFPLGCFSGSGCDRSVLGVVVVEGDGWEFSEVGSMVNCSGCEEESLEDGGEFVVAAVETGGEMSEAGMAAVGFGYERTTIMVREEPDRREGGRARHGTVAGTTTKETSRRVSRDGGLQAGRKRENDEERFQERARWGNQTSRHETARLFVISYRYGEVRSDAVQHAAPLVLNTARLDPARQGFAPYSDATTGTSAVHFPQRDRGTGLHGPPRIFLPRLQVPHLCTNERLMPD